MMSDQEVRMQYQERRLRALEDRAAIEDLVNEYADAARSGNPERLASVFSENAVLERQGSGDLKGREQIHQHFSASMTSGSADLSLQIALTPIMTNMLIEVDGDLAHCESFCMEIYVGVRNGETLVVARGAQNIDDLVRTEQGWKIVRRSHPAVWKFEAPGVSLGDG